MSRIAIARNVTARRGRGNFIMPEIAYSLDEDDIKSIAYFMSREGADAKS